MQRKPKTPGFVITASVLLFIYGGLMLVCTFCGVTQMALAAAPAPEGPPRPDDFFAQERELGKRIPNEAPPQTDETFYNDSGTATKAIFEGCIPLWATAKFPAFTRGS